MKNLKSCGMKNMIKIPMQFENGKLLGIKKGNNNLL